MLRTGIVATKYAFETLHNARMLAHSLRDASENPKVSEYLATHKVYSSSFMCLLGLMFYDMSVDRRCSKERKLVGKTSSRIILLSDIVDDVLDNQSNPLDYRFRFFDNLRSNLFSNTSYTSRHLQEEAAYALAKNIHKEFMHYDNDHKLEEISERLTEVLKRQFIVQDKEELLYITKISGAYTVEITAALTEIIRKREYPETIMAARKMGEYGEMLDNWYDLDDDLKDKVNTYPTVEIWEKGDTPLVRKNIKQKLFAEADIAIKEGFSYLKTEKQKDIYRVLKTFLDTKFRVIEKLQ